MSDTRNLFEIVVILEEDTSEEPNLWNYEVVLFDNELDDTGTSLAKGSEYSRDAAASFIIETLTRTLS